MEVTIYDVAGRRVGQAIHGFLPAGTHRVGWDSRREGADIASGVYFARFTAEGRAFTRRFLLLR